MRIKATPHKSLSHNVNILSEGKRHRKRTTVDPDTVVGPETDVVVSSNCAFFTAKSMVETDIDLGMRVCSLVQKIDIESYKLYFEYDTTFEGNIKRQTHPFNDVLNVLKSLNSDIKNIVLAIVARGSGGRGNFVDNGVCPRHLCTRCVR